MSRLIHLLDRDCKMAKLAINLNKLAYASSRMNLFLRKSMCKYFINHSLKIEKTNLEKELDRYKKQV